MMCVSSALCALNLYVFLDLSTGVGLMFIVGVVFCIRRVCVPLCVDRMDIYVLYCNCTVVLAIAYN